MTSEAWWLIGLLGLPTIVFAGSFARGRVERLRWLAVACASALIVLSSLALVVPRLSAIRFLSPWALRAFVGTTWTRMDTFSSVLIPLVALLWLLTVAVTPKARLDRIGLRRTAISTAITIGCFTTVSPILLLILSTASVVVLLAGLTDPQHAHARRVVGAYLGLSTLLLTLGLMALSAAGGRGELLESIGLVLVVAGILIRKGIFPFHAWIPEVFDHGRIGPSILFSAPQLGSYLLIVLVIPRVGPEGLRMIATLALLTAVYAAALALFQRSARRACGYLFVSQSALVMAGLSCSSVEAVTGALLLWISSALAFAGLARCVLVLEARRGRLDLSRYHGGFAQMPLLAASFLIMGLACTGFPGTLGFIAEEILVSGAVHEFPILGFSVIATGALTGLAVMRMYLSLFCGRADESTRLPLRRREAVVFAAIALMLLVAGVAPAPLVASRLDASKKIMMTRPIDADRDLDRLSEPTSKP